VCPTLPLALSKTAITSGWDQTSGSASTITTPGNDLDVLEDGANRRERVFQHDHSDRVTYYAKATFPGDSRLPDIDERVVTIQIQ